MVAVTRRKNQDHLPKKELNRKKEKSQAKKENHRLFHPHSSQTREKRRLKPFSDDSQQFEHQPLQHLRENYENPGSSIAFLSATSLYKMYGKRLSLKTIKSFLSTKESYTLSKNDKQKRQFNGTLAWHPFDLVQTDLVVQDSLAQHNENKRYILCVIDVYSKMLYTELMDKKDCTTTAKHLEKIFLRMPTIPRVCASDKGREFDCRLVRLLMKSYKMKQFLTTSDFKAAVVERVQLTLQRKLFRSMIARQSYNYSDVIEDIVHGYNQSYHRTIQMSPYKALEPENQNKLSYIYAKKVAKQSMKKVQPKFSVGQTVRVSFKRGPFSRGYGQSHSSTRYLIASVDTRFCVPTYKLKNQPNSKDSGEPVVGTFHQNQLTLVDIPEYRGSIVGHRTRKGVKQALMRFEGYSQEYDQWLPVESIKDVK